jgi:hypothetical protein
MTDTRFTLEQALLAAPNYYWEWSYDSAYRCFMRMGMKGSQLVELARVRAEKQYERQFGAGRIDLISLDQAWKEAKQFYWCMAYMAAFFIATSSGCTETVSRYLAETWADSSTEYQFKCPNALPSMYAECDDKCRHYIVEV